jgi:lysophospholipase L1-like esterase
MNTHPSAIVVWARMRSASTSDRGLPELLMERGTSGMRRRLTKLLCLATAGAAIGAVVTVSSPASADVTQNYVALGDSYAAGVGTFDYDSASGACLRSPESYPALWSHSHAPAQLNSVACSGAATSDVLSNQMSALNDGVTLVTVTVGGNDIGFSGTAATCILGTDSGCWRAVSDALTIAAIDLPARLEAVYAAIRSHAPNARVLVVGYPQLADETATSCTLSASKRSALNLGASVLDTVISDEAAAAGLTFVDPQPAFAGHGVCSGTPWINGFSTAHLTETFHPTADGYASGYLPALDDAIAQ